MEQTLLSTTVKVLGVTAVAISLVFSVSLYYVTNQNYNYLNSQQTSVSTAISNLVNQETSFATVLQQQSSVVNSLQQSVTNLNTALPSSHKGTYMSLRSLAVNYAGTSTTMLIANVTGFTSIQVYAGGWNIPLRFYFSQNETGPYYVVDCTITTPNVCNAGSANSIVSVPPMGNFIGITGITGTAQLYVSK